MTTFERWLRFNGVGLAGIGVQLATLTALVHVAGLDYRIATALAVVTAILHNFVWHFAWTWSDRRGEARPLTLLARFALSNGLTSITGNVVAMWLLVGVAGVPVAIANVLAITLCGLINFVLAGTLVFRRGGRPPVSHAGAVGRLL